MWHHIAVVINGTSGDITIYKNGVMVSSTWIRRDSAAWQNINRTNLYLGKSCNSAMYKKKIFTFFSS